MKRNNDSGDASVFRDRLRQLLGDMTTTEFANKVGVSRQTMGFYLNGDRIPDALTLLQICRACNVSAGWLLGQTEDPAVCPSAVDELGLSVLSINEITDLSLNEKRALDTLIEYGLCSIIVTRVSHYIDLIKREGISQLSKAQLISSILQADVEGRQLMAEISDKNPELKGRISVHVGVNHADYMKLLIVDQFSAMLGQLKNVD